MAEALEVFQRAAIDNRRLEDEAEARRLALDAERLSESGFAPKTRGAFATSSKALEAASTNCPTAISSRESTGRSRRNTNRFAPISTRPSRNWRAR
jgi:hypothetical protein